MTGQSGMLTRRIPSTVSAGLKERGSEGEKEEIAVRQSESLGKGRRGSLNAGAEALNYVEGVIIAG